VRFITRILTLCAVIFSSVSIANEYAPQLDNIEKSIENAMQRFQVPGVAVAIIKDDKIILNKGFGVTEHGTSEKVNADTLFGVASNTKAMTAALIAGLVDEGKLSWRTKVIDIIPEFQMPDPYVTREFTLIDLLSHNSGLGLGAGDLMIWPETTLGVSDILKGLKYLPEVSSFRSEFAYDNLMYVIAGEIIARVTGKSWEENIQTKIFDTLSMQNTRAKFSLIPTSNSNVARAHVPLDGKLHVVGGNFLEKFSSAGSVASSVNDMAKWLKIQLGTYNDNGFNKEFIKQSHNANRKVAPLGDGSSYAAGWFVYQKGGGEISHGGNNPNYSSFIVFSPEEEIGVALLSNINSSYVSYIGQAINEMLHKNEYNRSIKDMNKSADLISILIICTTTLIILSTLYFMINCFREIIKKERKFHKKDIVGILKLLVSLLFIIGVTYCIYLIQ